MKIFCSNPREVFKQRSEEIALAIKNVINSGIYINGENVDSFEENFAAYIGSKYSVGVSSGTSAIEMVLRSLCLDQTDEIITASHTAVATVSAIKSAGLTPVLADIDSSTYTLCPKSLINAITEKTKVVIVVHLYGQTAYLDKIVEICKRNSIVLIEDCSQAHGATWRGKMLGTFGIAGCFSCYPTKNLSALGDAGIITTNDSVLRDRLKMMREYGWDNKRDSQIDGGNYRLDEMQAAILNVQLKYLNEDNKYRQDIAEFYDRELPSQISRPSRAHDATHVFHLYVARISDRSKFIDFMKSYSIYPGIHYLKAVHQQTSFAKIKHQNLINTEAIIPEIISLPIYPGLENKYVDKICSLCNEYMSVS